MDSEPKIFNCDGNCVICDGRCMSPRKDVTAKRVIALVGVLVVISIIATFILCSGE
jgi:hypothetical protein